MAIIIQILCAIVGVGVLFIQTYIKGALLHSSKVFDISIWLSFVVLILLTIAVVWYPEYRNKWGIAIAVATILISFAPSLVLGVESIIKNTSAANLALELFNKDSVELSKRIANKEPYNAFEGIALVSNIEIYGVHAKREDFLATLAALTTALSQKIIDPNLKVSDRTNYLDGKSLCNVFNDPVRASWPTRADMIKTISPFCSD